ncbi:NO-inducible flavohemoprotein [Salibacterium halotolerans]|uniref:Flavohemoprotein n=1 Tax=Salibacterium halotolerans TaxID=1884432 RepID=A0A1I5SXE7_9BACI|nr:NO-inducible flavohemoprotein [Salibacterium halotolerans]SFP75388.1 nitric oxide dioxygenase [Salibacterium halotolerans]
MASNQTLLKESTMETVKATVPVLRERGPEITEHFYKRMFEQHPELLHIFNQTNQASGRQPKALAGTVLAAAENIDQLETILPVVREIAHKHRSLQVKPEHYPIVGENLLAAMKEVLGKAATDDIMAAWEEAYNVIADVFISVEKGMYQEAAGQRGGWEGFRTFTVAQKVKESDVITSFYLKPLDEGALPSFYPGQYVTVKADIPGEEYLHLRQYSMSDAPGQDHFRVSVKREDGTDTLPGGMVSTYLHHQVEEGDVLELTAPAGDFWLQEGTRPVVLISGGIGLTPLMSIFHTLVSRGSRPVTFIQTARSRCLHAMHTRTSKTADACDHVSYHVCYDTWTEEDERDPYIQKEGRLDAEWLRSIVPNEEADYYFCGPVPFLRAVNQLLRDELNIPKERRHFEFFGPAAELKN